MKEVSCPTGFQLVGSTCYAISLGGPSSVLTVALAFFCVFLIVAVTIAIMLARYHCLMKHIEEQSKTEHSFSIVRKLHEADTRLHHSTIPLLDDEHHEYEPLPCENPRDESANKHNCDDFAPPPLRNTIKTGEQNARGEAIWKKQTRNTEKASEAESSERSSQYWRSTKNHSTSLATPSKTECLGFDSNRKNSRELGAIPKRLPESGQRIWYLSESFAEEPKQDPEICQMSSGNLTHESITTSPSMYPIFCGGDASYDASKATAKFASNLSPTSEEQGIVHPYKKTDLDVEKHCEANDHGLEMSLLAKKLKFLRVNRNYGLASKFVEPDCGVVQKRRNAKLVRTADVEQEQRTPEIYPVEHSEIGNSLTWSEMDIEGDFCSDDDFFTSCMDVFPTTWPDDTSTLCHNRSPTRLPGPSDRQNCGLSTSLSSVVIERRK